MTTKQIIGTICACMGIVFASGDTIANGLLAIACFAIAAITLRPAVAKRKRQTPSISPFMGRTKNANKSIRMANRAA